jgi:hypothetical protein
MDYVSLRRLHNLMTIINYLFTILLLTRRDITCDVYFKFKNKLSIVNDIITVIDCVLLVLRAVLHPS